MQMWLGVGLLQLKGVSAKQEVALNEKGADHEPMTLTISPSLTPSVTHSLTDSEVLSSNLARWKQRVLRPEPSMPKSCKARLKVCQT